MVQAARQVIKDATLTALLAKAHENPLAFISMSVDVANQTNHVILKLYPPTRADDEYYFDTKRLYYALSFAVTAVTSFLMLYLYY